MTFVTFSDANAVAASLSKRNLGKQRVEAQQILNALENPGAGYSNHAITKAWRGHEDGLRHYINCMIDEFVRRGCKNNMPRHDLSHLSNVVMPWWFGWDRLHYSHRAQLIIKDPPHYGPIFQGEHAVPAEYLSNGYIWPHTILYTQQLTAPLAEIAAIQPDYLKYPAYCKGMFKNGKPCQILVKAGRSVGYCKRHLPKV